jgi:hypothetical protein
MIDTMRTILAATEEYEMRYGKHPVIFVNRILFKVLTADKYLSQDLLYLGYDKMLIYGCPAKLVTDDSDEMHFWIGEEMPIYEKGELI